jgi:hypothetical protein
VPNVFFNTRQEQVFDAVLSGIKRLDYRGDLLQENYEFTDWFSNATTPSTIAAAAFGRTPVDYDAACLAIFPAVSRGPPLHYRALGAPFGIEVHEDGIVPWSIGKDAQTTRPSGGRIPADAMDRFFQSVEHKWSPSEVLRAKNVGKPVGPSELDWIDLGLIPALEHEISTKLDRLLSEALSAGQRTYRQSTGQRPDVEALYRLVFRLVAGKVFHDRKVPGFRQLDATVDAREVLQKVCEFYKEPINYLGDRDTQQAVAETLWTKLGFQNLSVDALAFIYENTLVDSQLRKDDGIHSTPHRIARYVVEHLPFEQIPEADRFVVEPCSGHGVFLVAALKRLRELLGPRWDKRERHRYFVKRLFGFEQDAFAREVSKLCLTLADFPNPNGWNLEKADVFTSRKFAETLREGRIVLCNPPFEEFKKAERQKYGAAIGTSKPLEVLQRVLQHSHRDAIIGFVLPRPFLDGQIYRAVRRQLAERYAAIDLVTLPDKVFRHAEVETALVMAHSPIAHEQTRIHFSEVIQSQRDRFLDDGTATRSDTATTTPETAEVVGFHVPVLQEIWEHLAHLPKLGSVAEIHRGVEWKPPFSEAKYLSNKPKAGWWRGLRNVEEGFEAFSPPKPCWLNPDGKFRLYDAWSRLWDKPKVIANAATKARGSWRLAAAADETGLVCTQRYHCIWPKNGWSPKCLSALLNSPVASAFVAAREGKRDVRMVTLKDCPLPLLAPNDMLVLEGLVDDYVAVINEQPETRYELWDGGAWQDRAKRILLQMDALILKGYGLPPWLERKLLYFFLNEKRPVSFDFGDYFPANFAPNISLWRFISLSFQNSRPQNIVPHLPELRDEELTAALEELA